MSDDEDYSFATLRRRLAEQGFELPGDSNLRGAETEIDTSNPHVHLALHRVRRGFTPDYYVAGYVECVVCRQLCYLEVHELVLLNAHVAVPMCTTCTIKAMEKSGMDLGSAAPATMSTGPFDTRFLGGM